MLAQLIPQTAFDVKFRIGPFPLRIHPTFWIAAVLLSASLRDPLYMLVAAGVMLVSILIHELGHAFAARYFRDTVIEIVMYALGGLCIHEGRGLNYSRKIWISLWGPLAGFALCGLFAAGHFGLLHVELPAAARYALWCGLWFNSTVNALNLLPIFPLDGGQIFLNVLHWKYPERGDVLVFRVSLVTAMIMAVLSGVGAGVLGLGMFGVFLFGGLALNSYMNMRQMRRMGVTNAFHEDEDSGPRQPWERDADWWKK